MTEASPIRLPFALPFADSKYTIPPITKLAAPSKRRVLPVGEAYRNHASRVLGGHTLEEHEKILKEKSDAKRKGKSDDGDGEVDDGIGNEPESAALLDLDPRDWKNQDQYAVLGLSALRWKATPQQIKQAHRKKVLRHHPDKKAGKAGNANDDSFFKCIAKAYEVLSDPVKRRQFDSVDEEVDDDDVPTLSKLQHNDSKSFCKLFNPVFEREARFSTKQPVPRVGQLDSPREEVELFYNFWLTFDSWRSYEWKDKDANEGSDSRHEKRHVENKNRSERERCKKEDNARRRNLVEFALSNDPRMIQFRNDDRAKRESKKGDRSGATKAGEVAQEQEDPAQVARRKADEESQAAAKAEADKKARDVAKKAKEAAKKNLKKEKKAIVALVAGLNYFAAGGQSPSPATIEAQLSEVDAIADAMEPEDVVELRKAMEGAKAKGKDEVKRVIVSCATKVSQDGKGTFKEFV